MFQCIFFVDYVVVDCQGDCWVENQWNNIVYCVVICCEWNKDCY